MKIAKLSNSNKTFIKEHQLTKAYKKAKKLFELNSNSFVLNIKKIKPYELNFYSLRITQTYRAVFRIINNEADILVFCKNSDCIY